MSKSKIVILAIGFLHVCGFIFLQIPEFHSWVLPMTPVILLLSFAGALYADNTRLKTILLLSIIGILGFAAEAAGVSCGCIFGSYSYGNVLQPQFLGVPLIIGINWMALTYYSRQIDLGFLKNRVAQIIFPAVLMTVFDFILEPVAIHLGFWNWTDTAVPIQNYIAWFGLSLLFQIILSGDRKLSKTGTGKWIFLIQLMFFALLNLTF